MNRPQTMETLVSNLALLMERTGTDRKALSKRSGVSLRMVSYILTKERIPSVEIADHLAKAFGLSGWQLLSPSLTKDLDQPGHINELISNYLKATPEGREMIERLAEHEAKFGS